MKSPQPSYFSFNSIIENPKMKVKRLLLNFKITVKHGFEEVKAKDFWPKHLFSSFTVNFVLCFTKTVSEIIQVFIVMLYILTAL